MAVISELPFSFISHMELHDCYTHFNLFLKNFFTLYQYLKQISRLMVPKTAKIVPSCRESTEGEKKKKKKVIMHISCSFALDRKSVV